MRRVERHTISVKHPLYEWCRQVCLAANNLKNAGRFRQRNVYTALRKKEEDRHPLEVEVLKELEQGIVKMNDASRASTIEKLKAAGEEIPDKIPDKYSMPDESGFLNYNLLDGMMKFSDNPDYNNEYVGTALAQRTLQTLSRDMKSYAKSLKSYHEDPSKFSGKPELPGYCRKGGMSTAVFANDGGIKVYCVEEDKGGRHHFEMSIPKAPQRLYLGAHCPKGTIQELKIVPSHGNFIIHVTTDDGIVPPSLSEMSLRIAAIDLGVDNFAAVVNNCGLPCLLFKGGVVKAANQLYNKEMARIQSEQTKGGDEKFVMTDEAHVICEKRNNQIRDFILKVSKMIVDWSVDNRIDTIVIGLNTGWKDEVNLGDRNTQNFVQLPYNDFVKAMKWRCERVGIRLITREESYTSKASSLDEDFIPTYGEEKPRGGWKFSGYRAPTTRYYRFDESEKLVEYKVKPRGLYKSRKYGIVNSDLNGAANILRKEFPDAFIEGKVVDFGNVVVVRHPDYNSRCANRGAQHCEAHVVSRAKLRRDIAKGRISSDVLGNPSGVVAL